MHLLPCPTCNASISVAPSQAGDQTSCPHCSATVDIPTLGQIRLLPTDDTDADAPQSQPSRETSAPRMFGFTLFALASLATLLVGGYCGIRWVLIDASSSTEQHIAEMRTAYQELEPAKLIREYEDMEKYGLELPEPYPYKVTENMKRAWGRNASAALSAGVICLVVTVMLGRGLNRNR